MQAKIIPEFNKDKRFITVKEFSEITGIGLTNSYKILNRDDAPIFRYGRKIFIKKDKLDDWLDTLIGCQF